MPVISGTLKDGAGQPIASCTIQLRALNTTCAVIRTSTARVGVNTGAYRIEAQPGRYEVVLAVDDYPPQKVGIIDVYADSLDGTLNDYLTVVSGDYLIPDTMKQFEQLTQRAEASARLAETSAQGLEQLRTDAQAARDAAVQAGKEATDQAQQAGESAFSASRSATDSGTSARQSAADAVTSEDSSKASALSAQAAAASEKKAATSEQNAGASERNAKSSEDAAAHAASVATEQAEIATNAAKTAAKDAVATAVPEAARQIKTEIADDVNRAEAAASSAEEYSVEVKQALEDVKGMVTLPGFGEPGSYVLGFVWSAQADADFLTTGTTDGNAISVIGGGGGPGGIEWAADYDHRPLTGRWRAMSESFGFGTGGAAFLLQRIK
ncbi:prophage tail fiber N-terminal domain-containing protein [Salmonella enterica]|nr:prophage tail fiber N-terminal domain-containing protein [Salmonella enterica]